MNYIMHVAYILHLMGILFFDTYMTITFVLSLGAAGGLNDITAFVMLRCLFRDNMILVPLLVLVLESVSCATDDTSSDANVNGIT